MNDEDDYIVVRNQPNKRSILSTVQPSAYINDTELSLDIDSGLNDSMKRQRQVEYAEELRQQILQKQSFANNPQYRAFMSSLGSLHGDQSIEIERKRKQQEKLAESLRQQIEEKRRAREIERQKEAAREASREASYSSASNSNASLYSSPSATTSVQGLSNSINSGNNIININNNNNNRYLRQTRKMNFLTQPISREPYKTMTQNQAPKPLNEESGFSKTAPFAPIPHLTFEISSESPFSHSTVQTPPLGFSLRRNHPTSLSITAPTHNSNQPIIPVKNNFSKSALSQHQQPTQQSNPNRFTNSNYTNNSNMNNSVNKYDHQINLNVRNNDVPMKLGTVSELVYPDGHISPINSPH